MAEENELEVSVNPSELVLAGKLITIDDFSAWIGQNKDTVKKRIKEAYPDAIIKIGQKYIVNLEKFG